MEKLYVDTNIFIYLLISGSPHGAEAKKFFERCKEQKTDCWTSAYTLAEINSVLKSYSFNKKEIVLALDDTLKLGVKFIPLKEENIINALFGMSKGFSFGDSVHMATMRENKIKTIVSNDSDFERAGLKRVFL